MSVYICMHRTYKQAAAGPLERALLDFEKPEEAEHGLAMFLTLTNLPGTFLLVKVHWVCSSSRASASIIRQYSRSADRE